MSHVNPRMHASDSIPFWMYSVDVLILLHPCLHFVAIRIHVVAMYVCSQGLHLEFRCIFSKVFIVLLPCVYAGLNSATHCNKRQHTATHCNTLISLLPCVYTGLKLVYACIY
mmetsp:Transcript_55357/g.81374  ORF Transcript_55357/g.81374 Transcript_55357/m.81374 type:complete len:112 (+) Transcript_55357:133-468(+)